MHICITHASDCTVALCICFLYGHSDNNSHKVKILKISCASEVNGRGVFSVDKAIMLIFLLKISIKSAGLFRNGISFYLLNEAVLCAEVRTQSADTKAEQPSG